MLRKNRSPYWTGVVYLLQNCSDIAIRMNIFFTLTFIVVASLLPGVAVWFCGSDWGDATLETAYSCIWQLILVIVVGTAYAMWLRAFLILRNSTRMPNVGEDLIKTIVVLCTILWVAVAVFLGACRYGDAARAAAQDSGQERVQE